MREVNEAIDTEAFFDEKNEEKRAEELTKLLIIAGIDPCKASIMEKARKVIESFTNDASLSP